MTTPVQQAPATEKKTKKTPKAQAEKSRPVVVNDMDVDQAASAPPPPSSSTSSKSAEKGKKASGTKASSTKTPSAKPSADKTSTASPSKTKKSASTKTQKSDKATDPALKPTKTIAKKSSGPKENKLKPQDKEGMAEMRKIAIVVRKERASIKKSLKDGTIRFENILERIEENNKRCYGEDNITIYDGKLCGQLKVFVLLRSLPGVGKATADKYMKHMGISEKRKLVSLTDRQKNALIDAQNEILATPPPAPRTKTAKAWKRSKRTVHLYQKNHHDTQ